MGLSGAGCPLFGPDVIVSALTAFTVCWLFRLWDRQERPSYFAALQELEDEQGADFVTLVLQRELHELHEHNQRHLRKFVSNDEGGDEGDEDDEDDGDDSDEGDEESDDGEAPPLAAGPVAVEAAGSEATEDQKEGP
jgi:hypothetical protein